MAILRTALLFARLMHLWLPLGQQLSPQCGAHARPPPAPRRLEAKAPSACWPPTAQALCFGAPLEHVNYILEPTCGSWVSDVEVLKVERIQLIDAVLNLCTYHHPENIQLPPG